MIYRIWSDRLTSGSGQAGFRLAWHALSIAAVVLLPLRVAGDLAFWNATATDAAYSLLMAGVYATFALGLTVAAGRPNGVPTVAALLAGAFCYTAAFFFLLRHPSLRHAGALGAVASGIGVPLAIAPFMLRRFRGTALAALAAAVLLAVGANAGAPPAISERIVQTALQTLSITTYRNLIGPSEEMDGGAIARDGDRLLVITGDGTLYAVTPTAGEGVNATRLDVPAPSDRARYLADQRQPGRRRLRVTDLLVEPGSAPRRIFASHMNWDSVNHCITLRVSAVVLDSTGGRAASGGWVPLFDSSPCLSPIGLNSSETGGSLAWLDGRLLVTVGDHGNDGQKGAAVAQLDDNSYGKVIEIDPVSSTSRIFSKGHRNAQGLLVDRAGNIWMTEHGPSGGDELNLLQRGHNYGWPNATYGTGYGAQSWPLAPSARNHGSFTEPSHAFVPAVAMTGVIEVASPGFPRWQGDLLIGSLRARNLFRVRLVGTRVIYIEPVPIGREVRDLVEGPDGRLYLFTDDGGDILTIAPAGVAASGPEAFVRCGVCHEGAAGSERSAPSLRGVIGQTVAGASGFTYSPALTALRGRWTEERLDAFLADPGAFAPGSSMESGQVIDPVERRAIIEFLKAYR